MGVPGAGKSYVAAHLHRTLGFSVVSGESVTFALFQRDKCTSQEYSTAYAVARALAREQLVEGYDVVFDSSNVRRIFRQQIYGEVADIDCRISGIFLRVSEERALKRLSARGSDQRDIRDVKSSCTSETLRSFYRDLEVPGRDEPFVEVDAETDDTGRRVEVALYDDTSLAA